jgi:hypothetical protein
VRLALSRTPTGKAAAGSTQRRKRPVFCNALGYAVEQGHLAANPIDRIQWTTPAVAQTVDRRAVVSPARPGASWPPSGDYPTGDEGDDDSGQAFWNARSPARNRADGLHNRSHRSRP